MKKLSILSVLLALALCLCACSAPAAEPQAQPTEAPAEAAPAPTEAPAEAPAEEPAAEVYEGVGQGNNGDIKVAVTVEDGAIIAVEVLSHSETAGISDPAITAVPAAIVEANSTDVDTVSGATNTSEGIIEAVADALAKAGIAAEAAEEGWKSWPTLSVYAEKEQLDAYKAEAEQKMVDAALEYAPTVKTLESGIKVQAVPSDGLCWNVKVLNGENRGCEACHTLEDALYNLYLPHSGLGGEYPTQEISINTCLVCHKQIFDGKYGSRTSIREAMHGLHLNSKTFDGNCYSCHLLDKEGNYKLWDNEKYNVLRGINWISNYQGQFSFDQNVTISQYETFTHISEQNDPNGITVLATDDVEAYEKWEVKITGACDNQFAITLPTLDQFPTVDRILKNHCVINGLGDAMIKNCNVQGIDMNDLIALAQPQEGANYVYFHAADNYANDWIAPLDFFDIPKASTLR